MESSVQIQIKSKDCPSKSLSVKNVDVEEVFEKVAILMEELSENENGDIKLVFHRKPRMPITKLRDKWNQDEEFREHLRTLVGGDNDEETVEQY